MAPSQLKSLEIKNMVITHFLLFFLMYHGFFYSKCGVAYAVLLYSSVYCHVVLLLSVIITFD